MIENDFDEEAISFYKSYYGKERFREREKEYYLIHNENEIEVSNYFNKRSQEKKKYVNELGEIKKLLKKN